MEQYKLEKPFFSVVIPTYNHEAFLEKAVKSVLNQTFSDYEIIIIDNYSDDNTENLIKNLNNKNIKFIKNRNHGILAKSRNIGIEQSKSEWIAFLDSDDIWWQDRLKVLFDFIKKHNNYDVICTNELWINKMNNKKNNKTRASKYGPYKNNFYEILLKYGNCMSTSASVVKKKYLIDNKIFFSEEKDFTPYEDYDFWMRIAKNNGKFKFLNEVLGEHLFHPESWSEKNRSLVIKSTFAISRHHVFNVQNFTNRKKNLWSHIECRIILNDIIGLLFSKKYFKGFVELFKLFCRYPIKLITHILFKLKRIFLFQSYKSFLK